MQPAEIRWIAVDWGTTNLRVWAMGQDDKPLANAQSGQGMASLDRADFEPALLALISPWLREDYLTPALACGMVGARQGWLEATYTPVPCAPLGGADYATPRTGDPRFRVHIIPGLMQAEPPDVMRGEETQIAGFLAEHPDFEGTVCLPGTHTKWVDIQGGIVKRFHTTMTGELFAILSEQSVLRHSIGSGWDSAAFDRAFETAITDPEGLARRLFSIRAGSLVANLAPDTARATLSGLLIGSELAAIPRPEGRIAVIGPDNAAAHYRRALELVGRPALAVKAQGITLNGLTQAYHALQRSIAE